MGGVYGRRGGITRICRTLIDVAGFSLLKGALSLSSVEVALDLGLLEDLPPIVDG